MKCEDTFARTARTATEMHGIDEELRNVAKIVLDKINTNFFNIPSLCSYRLDKM